MNQIKTMSIEDAVKTLIDNDLQYSQPDDSETVIKFSCYLATKVIQNALRKGYVLIKPEDVITETDSLRRNIDAASCGAIDHTPEEAEAKRRTGVVDSIIIQSPTNVSVERITHYADDILCRDDPNRECGIKTMTTREIIIKGITIDNQYFLIKINPHPGIPTKIYTGLEALREGKYENIN